LCVLQRKRQPIDLAAVRDDLKAAQLIKVQAEVQMSGVIDNLTRLQSMGKDRLKRMMDCRKSMANSANFAFGALLKPQGAHGQLKFDHKNQVLDLIVNPNTRDTERQDTSGASVLSGGERSVTTIAFMMAIGEQVECPFRAIDEFDVFMDSLNRQTSMDLLLQIAKHRKDRQFFFLSPQDINGLKPTPYFAVHKLPEPIRNARNQSRLPFNDEDQEEEEHDA
jgi:chromosome segregation ATPase